MVSEKELQREVIELGAQAITADYAGRPPLLVGVLKGACFFLSDLARAIRLPIEIDFMAVSSYGSATTTGGVVRIVKDLDSDLTGRHVLIVEDIVDSGLTLSFLRRNLAARHPASLEIVALLVKEGLQSVDLHLAYVGFTIPPDFVIGYGLDVAERYRNLPYLATYLDSPRRNRPRLLPWAGNEEGLPEPRHLRRARLVLAFWSCWLLLRGCDPGPAAPSSLFAVRERSGQPRHRGLRGHYPRQVRTKSPAS